MLNTFFKRVFDIVFSIFGLLILSPVLLFCAWRIKSFDGENPIFKQERIGQFAKKFEIWKFRTMTNKVEISSSQITVGQDPRITQPGVWLRKYKLDELPQLFNVLKGEMSFVGPRPEVPRYVALYSTEQKQILKYKPGITDPSSLEFSNESELLGQQKDPETFYVQVLLPRKLNLSLDYLSRANIFSDVLIILKTLGRVLGLEKKNNFSPST